MASFAVIAGKSRYSAPTRHAPSLQVSIAFGIAATGAYLLLTSIALTELFAWSPVFQTPAQAASGFGDSTQVLRSEPAADAVVAAADVVVGEPMVLTITIDGPAASVDVFCMTSADRTSFDRVHVRPEDTMRIYNQLCVPSGAEW